MPRARKAEVPAGQAYGQRQRLEEAQMPVDPTGGVSIPSAPPAGPDWASILSAAQAGPSPVEGGLFRPTERPNEPLTAGMPIGPGPGREAVSMYKKRNLTAEALERIAMATDDPVINALAQRARMRGA